VIFRVYVNLPGDKWFIILMILSVVYNSRIVEWNIVGILLDVFFMGHSSWHNHPVRSHYSGLFQNMNGILMGNYWMIMG
jgi:hypothetical protein